PRVPSGLAHQRALLLSLGSFGLCFFSSWLFSLLGDCLWEDHRTLVRSNECWLRLGNLVGAFLAIDALELLPVTGDLQQCVYLLGWLSANGQPVLCTVRVDLDNRRVLGWVVLTDLLDGTAIALGARVHNNNAVERCAHLTEALQTNLYGHFCGLLFLNMVESDF